METPKVRRRRRRRRSRFKRETVAWLSLLLLAIRNIYHWGMLGLIVLAILLIGFAWPALI